jgi:hypothetical protein
MVYCTYGFAPKKSYLSLSSRYVNIPFNEIFHIHFKNDLKMSHTIILMHIFWDSNFG